MSSQGDANPFAEIGFEDFRRMARDPSLSAQEKIGFPDAYREGHEDAIHADIRAKLPNLDMPGARVLDIGPGCAGLPRRLIADCAGRGQHLVLVDSEEMLEQLPDGPGVSKIAGFFPDCSDAVRATCDAFDAIVCYSVFHYVFVEAGFWRFVDQSIELLAPGGRMLIGDIPNVSKRKRFFASENGVRFHQAFMRTDGRPTIHFNVVEPDRIDDAAVLGIVMRARAQGCDAYWLPQPPSLPMANRREDIVLHKP